MAQTPNKAPQEYRALGVQYGISSSSRGFLQALVKLDDVMMEWDAPTSLVLAEVLFRAKVRPPTAQ